MRSEDWPDWRVAAAKRLRRDTVRAAMAQGAREYVEAQEMIGHIEGNIQRVLKDPYFGMEKPQPNIVKNLTKEDREWMVELLPNGGGELHKILGVEKPQGMGPYSNDIPLIARAQTEIKRLLFTGDVYQYDWWRQSVKDRPWIIDNWHRYGSPQEDRPKILFPDAIEYKTEMKKLAEKFGGH